MKDFHTHSTQSEPDTGVRKRRHPVRTAVKVLAWTLGSLLVLVVGAVVALTLLLTPERLTRLINREASEYLKADVRVENARFTLWSTFPRFVIRTDSITVISRTLRGVSPEIRRQLPPDPDFLASASSLRGGINIVKFLQGKYVLHDLDIDRLHLNLVAYNDSVNNYNIAPSDLQLTEEVPYFTADRITVRRPGDFSFYSAATRTQASARLGDVTLVRTDARNNVYKLRVPGSITADVQELHLLHDFPFELDGRVALGFRPFRFTFDNYQINLGNTRGELDMNLRLGRDMAINSLEYNIREFNLLGLLHYLPESMVPTLSNVHADLDVRLSARLTKPYHFSSTVLPSIEIDATVPAGKFTYTLYTGRTFHLHHSKATARMEFDGDNTDASYIRLDPLQITSPQARATVSADVTDIMASPLFDFRVKAGADIAKVMAMVPDLKAYSASGDFACDTRVRFRLASLTPAGMRGGLLDSRLDGTARIDNARVRTPRGILTASEIGIAAGGSDPEAIRLQGGGAAGLRIPVTTRVTARDVDFQSPADSLSLHMANLRLQGTTTLRRTPDMTGIDAALAADSIRMIHPGASLYLTSLDVDLDTRKPSAHHDTLPLPARSNGAEDARTLAAADHTPEFLTVNTPAPLLDLMEKLDFKTRVRARDGRLLSTAYPTDNRIGEVDVTLTFDSIRVRRLSLRSQQNAMRMRGTLKNLRQFLTSKRPAYLVADLDLDLDTVNINQLARTYQNGVAIRHDPSANDHRGDTVMVDSDTVTAIIPRNLIADIDLSADETIYTNLHLYDLSGGISLRDGNAHIEDLRISSDFGRAEADVHYLTSDLQRMRVGGSVDVSDVNVVNFFKNFHKLLLLMPQMRNLEGMLSLQSEFGVDIFPDMYLNVPSLKADVRVQGRGLTVHQDEFIRHITKMMLIKNADDIHIANMNVQATVHDNLLELYPFDFQFDRYKVNLVGLNNFNGKLYYHIGVEESPVPFPFGINIVGRFRDPELRFGGATFKVDKAREVSERVMERNPVNLLKELRHYLHIFIDKAAAAAP